MLDYFGSVTINQQDAIERIIIAYQNKIDENSLKSIIKKLVENEIIKKEYSITGWNMYVGKELYRIIDNEIKIINQEKKLAFAFLDIIPIDIIENICSYI